MTAHLLATHVFSERESAFMSETTPVLLGMSGSLRAGSYSNAILATLRETFAGRADLQLYDLAPIPLYNQDFEGDKRPPIVKQLLADIESADGLVFCAPEFNHSIPGVLKNAIDWASRPAFQSVLAYKPVAIMATSRGPLGGARCLEHMKVALDSCLQPRRACPRGHHHRGRNQDPRRPPGGRNLPRLRMRRGRGAAHRNPSLASGSRRSRREWRSRTRSVARSRSRQYSP